MNVYDMIDNPDILACWEEVRKKVMVKGIIAEKFQFNTKEYRKFLWDEVVDAAGNAGVDAERYADDMAWLAKEERLLVIGFTTIRMSRDVPYTGELAYEEMSSGHSEDELGISYQELLDETYAIMDIGVLFSYLTNLVFLLKYPGRYRNYLMNQLCLSEVHAKELIGYEKRMINEVKADF